MALALVPAAAPAAPRWKASDLRTSISSPPAFRSKARVLAPEAFDPGQPVEHAGVRGIVWSLAPIPGRGLDARWVLVEDGSIRQLQLTKAPAKAGGELRAGQWQHASWDYHPAGAVPFKVAEFLGEQDGGQLQLAA